VISFQIIKVAKRIDAANVELALDNFGASNQNNMLVVTGRTTFK